MEQFTTDHTQDDPRSVDWNVKPQGIQIMIDW